MSHAELLERHPLLARLDRHQLDLIADAGEVEHFAPGEEVVGEGRLGDALYLVLTGRVAVSKVGHPLATLEPGDFFGEMSMLEPAPRSASVTATEPAYLFRLPQTAVQALIAREPAAAIALLVHMVKTLSERLRRANDTLSSVGGLADWLAGSLV
ncbi:MAG: cyclic nucleotide-binding domain-containing protein [Kofleriaceae bacterium]|nr:cyclic nucleotide-binding domain-containing protein [Myxococcales bacterium]MCB9565255.1 cyclic nucleotide-binding domain-containing protein [Kofleriaceae bacterium]MCB9572383.1 cyclic nucleotide-binding domain-containing protein [Kofleriaceae bacterium]